jgi:hypothetical protein
MAAAIAKGYPSVTETTPTSVEVGSTNTRSDAAKAYAQLETMAL